MLLPDAEHAVVELDKLREYCLNPSHSRGRHKARVFASALQMVQLDAEFLRERLLEAARTCEAVPASRDKYGDRYTVDFSCDRGDRRALIRSGWIIRTGESSPRLTTCYVVLEEESNG
jgi:hypothetical protein